MVKVVQASYESDRYDDPDSFAGGEERIYFSDVWKGFWALPRIIDTASTVRLFDLYACFKLKGEARDKFHFCLPSNLIVDKLGRWKGEAMFKQETDIELYLSARPRFDQEKLMLLLMKVQPGDLA